MRRATSGLMTTLTALCTLLAVSALLIILTYIAWQGIGSPNWHVFIARTRRVVRPDSRPGDVREDH